MLDDAVEIVRELPRLPPRRPDSNKGDYGRILVIAGSRGMAGAGVLCASAALRAGAGLVRLAVPHELLPTVAIANPCVMTAGLPQDDSGRFGRDAADELAALAQANDVIAVGPGLGRSPDLEALLQQLLARCERPLVLDADGLNNVAKEPMLLSKRVGPTVITPHPGELARLLHIDTARVQADRRGIAARFARAHGTIVVLKGNGTVVADGERLYCNATGNPGMATAGSGDVLTGIIAAFIGQGLAPFTAACVGARVHGMAGDLARDVLGEISIIATDLIDYLPRALQQYQSHVI